MIVLLKYTFVELAGYELEGLGVVERDDPCIEAEADDTSFFVVSVSLVSSVGEVLMDENGVAEVTDEIMFPAVPVVDKIGMVVVGGVSIVVVEYVCAVVVEGIAVDAEATVAVVGGVAVVVEGVVTVVVVGGVVVVVEGVVTVVVVEVVVVVVVIKISQLYPV
jgi:hypothetical protein